MRADQVAAAAASLFLGAVCAGCGAPGPSPCRVCRDALAAARPLAPWLGSDALVVAAGEYGGVTRSLILAAKERGALGTVPVLGRRLALAVAVLCVAAEAPGPVLLAPVPSPRQRVALRGLDFTGALAGSASRHLSAAGVPATVCRVLRLRRRPEDQAGLGEDERHRNLAGAFCVAGRVPPGTLVVVDDIVTTGATILEALRALRATGREPLGAASVAATPRSRGARRCRTPL